MRLADLSAFQFETTDLTELAVGRIKVGDTATVAVDALPGVEIAGRVARLSTRRPISWKADAVMASMASRAAK